MIPTILLLQTLSVIFKSGFSRIPVYAKDQNDVIGLLFTKDLIFIDPDDETPLKNFVQIFGRAVTVRDISHRSHTVGSLPANTVPQ